MVVLVHEEVVAEGAAMVIVVGPSPWLLEGSLLEGSLLVGSLPEGSLLPLSDEPVMPLDEVGPSFPPVSGGSEDVMSSLYSTSGPGLGYTGLSPSVV